MGPIKLHRRWSTWASVVGVVLSGGCAFVGNLWNQPDAQDADEGYAVCHYVSTSGTVPECASVGRRQTNSCRFLQVVGVEDRATQDEILKSAVEARRLYSTKPVEVTFYAGTVVKDRFGTARYPGGIRELRSETVP